jgi:hypothetical protein
MPRVAWPALVVAAVATAEACLFALSAMGYGARG